MTFHQLPCNVLKCGDITPQEDIEYEELKSLMLESRAQFKIKILSKIQSLHGYYKITNYIQKNPSYFESLLKVAIIFKIYSIIQWFCSQNLLHKAVRLYSSQFMCLAIPDKRIVLMLLHYGFANFLKPTDFSFLSIRQISPLLHAISYLNYDLIENMMKYHSIMPNIQIILTTNSAHDLYIKSMLPLQNIVLFINKKKRKLYKGTLYENGRRRHFSVPFPYIVFVQGVGKIRQTISFNSDIFQTLFQILQLLFYKGSPVALSKISEHSILPETLIKTVVHKSSMIKNSFNDLQFLHNTFPFISTPRTLQRECSNTIKTRILLISGIRNFQQNVNSLPLTFPMKEYLKS
jgi:hypothetical protein